MKNFLLKTVLPGLCVFGGIIGALAFGDHHEQKSDTILAGLIGLSTGLWVGSDVMYRVNNGEF